MPRIRLLHWKAAEAAGLIELLKGAGCQVEYEEQFRPGLMREWREAPPDAFVIDLTRLPSHGREIAVALRQSRATRHVPVIFCEGAEEKVAAIRALLPDANYCTRTSLKSTLRKAVKHRPTAPVVPKDMMHRYAGRSATQKLGIKPGSKVALIDAPREGVRALGELPQHVQFCEDPAEAADVILCFSQDPALLATRLSQLRARARATKLWVVWRKGGSAARGEVTENVVRDQALDLGLVDYKVCSVNEVWSAILFAAKR
jgi:CheY-like chemotaxis protein